MRISVNGKNFFNDITCSNDMFIYSIGEVILFDGKKRLILDYDLKDGHIAYWLFNYSRPVADYNIDGKA